MSTKTSAPRVLSSIQVRIVYQLYLCRCVYWSSILKVGDRELETLFFEILANQLHLLQLFRTLERIGPNLEQTTLQVYPNILCTVKKLTLALYSESDNEHIHTSSNKQKLTNWHKPHNLNRACRCHHSQPAWTTFTYQQSDGSSIYSTMQRRDLQLNLKRKSMNSFSRFFSNVSLFGPLHVKTMSTVSSTVRFKESWLQ